MMVKHLETETVSCGVQDPRVIIGTLDAGVKPQRFPRQFSCCEGAGVGKGTERLSLILSDGQYVWKY